MAAVVPPREVANAHFEPLGTDDGWIRERTGIATRRWAEPGVSAGDLGAAAGRLALERSPGRCDAVIVCTTTPDHTCPATAPDVARRLGQDGAAAFDLNAACSGFVYGVATASALILSGMAERVLVVGTEVLTSITDPADRGTAILFGDGAAAAVLTRGGTEDDGAVLGLDLGSDGAGAPLLCVPAGGSRRPLDVRSLAAGDGHLRMDGSAVYRHAVERMTASARTCLDDVGMDTASVARFVGHQANGRILSAVAERLGVPPERHFTNVARYGNTSSASVPLALCDLSAHDPPAAGAPVLVTAFGAGFTWGSALLRWPGSTAIAPPIDYAHEEH